MSFKFFLSENEKEKKSVPARGNRYMAKYMKDVQSAPEEGAAPKETQPGKASYKYVRRDPPFKAASVSTSSLPEEPLIVPDKNSNPDKKKKSGVDGHKYTAKNLSFVKSAPDTGAKPKPFADKETQNRYVAPKKKVEENTPMRNFKQLLDEADAQSSVFDKLVNHYNDLHDREQKRAEQEDDIPEMAIEHKKSFFGNRRGFTVRHLFDNDRDHKTMIQHTIETIKRKGGVITEVHPTKNRWKDNENTTIHFLDPQSRVEHVAGVDSDVSLGPRFNEVYFGENYLGK